jgi:hypothetical protein
MIITQKSLRTEKLEIAYLEAKPKEAKPKGSGRCLLIFLYMNYLFF